MASELPDLGGDQRAAKAVTPGDVSGVTTTLLIEPEGGAQIDLDGVDAVYEPQGRLAEAFNATDDEIIVSGPAGTGKSRMWLEKMDYLCRRYPGCRALMLRKTRASLTDSALVTFERDVLLADDPMARNQQRSQRVSYDYGNGSTIAVRGLDQASRVMSTEWDFVFVQEAVELIEPEWEALGSRMRSGVIPIAQLVGDTNPDAPTHWIQERARRGALRLIESRHEDNPRYFNPDGTMTTVGASYMRFLDRLTGTRFLRLRKGLWVAAAGAVYEDSWDPTRNVIPAREIPKHWPRIRSIDFGYIHPFVCQWWALDEDERLYLYREVYATHHLVEDWAHLIYSLSKGEQIVATVCDHDAEGRATLERHLTHGKADCNPKHFGGGVTIPAHKDVLGGIDKVSARMVLQGDGKPRLFIVQNARMGVDQRLVEAKKPTSTEEEIPRYVRAEKRGQLGTHTDEMPRKLDDDGCDAMRYAVEWVEDPLRAYGRVMGETSFWSARERDQEAGIFGKLRDQMEEEKPRRQPTW